MGTEVLRPHDPLARHHAAAETAYAGPAFGATVDDSATRELRRLLGLERFTTN